MFNQNHSHLTRKIDSINFFLTSCFQTKDARSVKKLHGLLLRTGFSYTESDDRISIQSLSSFFKCMNSRNPLPFNPIISNFCRNGLPIYAIKMLSFMHSNGVAIDTYALCSSLSAAACIKSVEFGKNLHGYVEKSGWISSVFVGSAVIDLYAKSLLVNDAAMVFDEMPVRNIVCANALLSGYGDAKMWCEGLELIWKMKMLNLEYDHFTFSALLRSCAGLCAIELGRQVHAYIFRKTSCLEHDVFLQSSLIEMYGKCGLVDKALQVFNLAGIRQGQRKKDVVLWTSMLGTYGRNGRFQEVIELYKEMLNEGIKPDNVAFVTVISACGHTGHVNLGISHFESMAAFGLKPGPEHYSCVVDLLCRAGELDKAWKMVNEMKDKGHGSSSVSMWGALLSACMDWGNVEMGKLAAQRAIELDPQNDGIYVMLSNLYAKFGMWNEIEKLRESMKNIGLQKDVACSRLEFING